MSFGWISLDVLVIIVAINALVTISIWKMLKRKADKPPQQQQQPKKSFITELQSSGPITPKPLDREKQTANFGFFHEDYERRFFIDFLDFAAVVNWWFRDRPEPTPWRLQELPNIRITSSDMPAYGRRYQIFYNQVPVGKLQIRPGFPYTAETPNLYTDIELDYVRLFSWDVKSFLSGIAMHVTRQTEGDDDYDANRQIESAINEVMWQAQQVDTYDLEPDWGELTLHLFGKAQFYIDRRNVL